MLIAGDIGGTKTDIAIFRPEDGPHAHLIQKRFASREYPSLEAIVRECLNEHPMPVTHGCFAVAGPVVDGKSKLTNLPWVIDEEEMRTALGLQRVTLLNDVEAMAVSVPYVDSKDLRVLREGLPVPKGAIAFIAPGTGLGEAFLTWDGQRYRAHPSEGSHVDFSPTTGEETELLRFLQKRWGRVSYERACAGQSIPDLYDFQVAQGQIAPSKAVEEALEHVDDRTPTIVAAALAEEPDPLCLATMNMFVTILGAAAGNLALTVMATGGIYIAGGIAHRAAVEGADGHVFLAALERKGRLSPVMQRVPVYLVIRPIALLGAAITALDYVDASREVAA